MKDGRRMVSKQNFRRIKRSHELFNGVFKGRLDAKKPMVSKITV